jgi:hypothetical protein
MRWSRGMAAGKFAAAQEILRSGYWLPTSWGAETHGKSNFTPTRGAPEICGGANLLLVAASPAN